MHVLLTVDSAVYSDMCSEHLPIQFTVIFLGNDQFFGSMDDCGCIPGLRSFGSPNEKPAAQITHKQA